MLRGKPFLSKHPEQHSFCVQPPRRVYLFTSSPTPTSPTPVTSVHLYLCDSHHLQHPPVYALLTTTFRKMPLGKQVALQAHLEAQKWKAAVKVLKTIPTSIPKNSPPHSISSCLELVRAAADSLVEICDFKTAFESALPTRRALLDADLISWAVSALNGFSFDERIVARLATVLGLLGIGAEGRGCIGCAGAVDALALVWKSHPSCIEIVNALVSLCAGHIDNVSRMMRRRGIQTAITVLKDTRFQNRLSLREQTLVLLSLCSICAPDNDEEASQLVPTLLTVIKDDSQRRKGRIDYHALLVLANIADCWSKEGCGYNLGPLEPLITSVITAWQLARTSREMAYAASWALTALTAADEHVIDLLCGSPEIVRPLIFRWKDDSNTMHGLWSWFNTEKTNLVSGQDVTVTCISDDDSMLAIPSTLSPVSPLVPSRRRVRKKPVSESCGKVRQRPSDLSGHFSPRKRLCSAGSEISVLNPDDVPASFVAQAVMRSTPKRLKRRTNFDDESDIDPDDVPGSCLSSPNGQRISGSRNQMPSKRNGSLNTIILRRATRPPTRYRSNISSLET